MARLEIPSIVVHAGSCSCPSSPRLERASRASPLEVSMATQGEVVDNENDNSEEVDKPSKSAEQATEQADPPLPQSAPTAPPVRQKSQNSKVKLLVRSHAMREETSPPPDPERVTLEPALISPSAVATATSARPSSRLRLKHQGSAGSVDSNSPLSLSRDSSTEQPPTADSSGVDLPSFLSDTVNRSHKDRQLLLYIEQELIGLMRDLKRPHFKFPVMSSYQRMLVHRMAALYNMEHNVDSTGTQVVVARIQGSKLPDLRLRDQVRGELEPEPRRSILKRDTNSLEDTGFKASTESRRSKSFEEREEEYEKARKRIFKQDGRGDSGLGEGDEIVRSSQEELRGTWAQGHTWSSSESSDGRPQLLRPSPPHSSALRPGRLLKVESFESRDHLRANSLRQAVSKSYSFGGYSGGVAAPSMARGDSMVSTHSAGARLLTKQDSGGSSVASRLSPQSSGYKSLGSQRSDATLSATPSPTATPLLPHPPCVAHPAPTLVWAVTNMDAVPPGSVLINPQTGQPYVNSDGSLYRFDPANPPRLIPASEHPPVHCAPQPPSIQVHPSYTCAPAPPNVDYHTAPPPPQQQVVYTYSATASAHQQHTHPPCHAQEGCVGTMGAVSELATFLAGLQMGTAENSTCPGPAPPPHGNTNYVVAPGWTPPAHQPCQQNSRPPLLPNSSSQQSVVLPTNQPTVLLVPPPSRPVALFPQSGTDGYYPPPQQMMAASPCSSNNPVGAFPSQHAIQAPTTLVRATCPLGDNNLSNAQNSNAYLPATPTGMCPSSVPAYCYNSGQEDNNRERAWCHGCLQNSPQMSHPHQNITGPSSSYQPPWQLSWPIGKPSFPPQGRNSKGHDLPVAGILPGYPDQNNLIRMNQGDNKPQIFTLLPSLSFSQNSSEFPPRWGGAT